MLCDISPSLPSPPSQVLKENNCISRIHIRNLKSLLFSLALSLLFSLAADWKTDRESYLSTTTRRGGGGGAWNANCSVPNYLVQEKMSFLPLPSRKKRECSSRNTFVATFFSNKSETNFLQNRIFLFGNLQWMSHFDETLRAERGGETERKREREAGRWNFESATHWWGRERKKQASPSPPLPFFVGRMPKVLENRSCTVQSTFDTVTLDRVQTSQW